MNFEHFLSKRILSARSYKNSISAPIIKIGVTAISIGMIVMIVSVGVGIGMQKEIKDKISAFEGDISIQSFNNTINENSINPILPSVEFLEDLRKFRGVKNFDKIISKFGIVRTLNDFDGLYFKGVEKSYDFSRIKRYIIEGTYPVYSDGFSNDVLISKTLSDKLNLELGDSFQMLFSKSENPKPSILRLQVVGVFNSGFQELDSKYIFGDINQIRRILKWENDEISSIEIQLNEQSNLEFISEEIYLNSPSEFDVITTKKKYFSVYEWIDLFDKNIYAIIFIMIVVASINIISVLVVLILERTNMIGVLKALGITNFSLQKFFIYISSYLILIGIVIGNIFGLMILFIQEKYKIISLDPKIYYVDSVPIHIELSHIISLNLIAFFLCVLSIFIPSLLVSRINPKDSIKFN